ncbi:MAG: TolC family protein [Bryobacterales bacterium]|nr:TolC family protein [Bryobacterales bacterium]
MYLFLALPLAAADKLTLEQAFLLAEQNNPQLAAGVAQVEGARAGIVTALAYPNPEAGYIAGPQHARMFGAVPGVDQIYSFSQPLETRGVRQARQRAAGFARDGSQFALAETRIAIRAAVKQSFYQVLRRQSEIIQAQDNLRLVEELRRRIKVQVEVGEAAKLELIRADAEVATARNFARSAQLRLVTAISALRAAISAPLSPGVELVGQLDPPALLPPLDTLRTEVLERYPTLAQSRAEIRRAEARVQMEVAMKTPQPTIRSEFEQQPDMATFRIGLSLPVPAWNRRQGPIAEATAQLRQTKATAEWRRIEITSALESAYGRYEVASQQVASFQEGVLLQAQAALDAAEAAYKFGERGIIEVLDAQRVLRSARLDYLNAQYDRQASLIELEQLRAVDLGRNTP